MAYASIERPWLKYVGEERMHQNLPRCTMYEHLCNENRERLSQTAMDYYGTKITYGTMIKQIDNYAELFYQMGVRQGEYVTFLTVSIPETIYSIYALNKLGAVCNFIDVRTDEPHIVEFTKKAKSRLLIVIEDALDKVKDHFDEMEIETVLLQSGSDSLSFAKRIANDIKKSKCNSSDRRVIKNRDFLKIKPLSPAPAAPYQPDTPAVVTRTGGTTGKSKGVLLTNDCMNANDANIRDSILSGMTSGKSLLNFLPLAASYGIVAGVHIAFCRGSVNILIPRFKPADFPDLVCCHKPNYIIGVPVFYESLMADPNASKLDYSFITAMVSGGDSANAALENRLYEFITERGGKYPLAQGYGMSESTSVASFAALDVHKNGSAGLPCVHTLITVFRPDSEEELPIGEIGEICISGPTVMKEYLDEPEETAGIIRTHADGRRWIHSGDLGRIDEDGFLFVEGRIKRSIIRFDGHKVYPLQLEEIVQRLPEVQTVCVIPVKDLQHDQGDLPLIIIEADKNQAIDNNALVEKALDLCRHNIELRSQPATAIVIDHIPLTSVGKNDVLTLIEKYGHYQYIQ